MALPKITIDEIGLWVLSIVFVFLVPALTPILVAALVILMLARNRADGRALMAGAMATVSVGVWLLALFPA